MRLHHRLSTFVSCGLLLATTSPTAARTLTERSDGAKKDATVLILGGGVSGVIAARTFHEQGIDFKIVEAQSQLGGRVSSFTFGASGKEFTLENGANWVQGTVTEGGPENPIWGLVQKHGVKTQDNDWTGSITTYDATGPVDYLDLFNDSIDAFTNITILAGERVAKRQVDLSSRTGYQLIGSKLKTAQAMACEYYQLDWESAGTPEESSLITTSWAANFTYDPDFGGFGDSNAMSVDQRGFHTFIQLEANEFLQPSQVLLNSTVTKIGYSTTGAHVTLSNGKTLTSDYVLSTFSLGVLQNDDVEFNPPLPSWKQEAIQTMTMETYTKIFLQFPNKFWFDTEMGLYADPERGRYPVWQSLDHPDFFPGSGIFFVTVTGDYSVRVEALSDSEIQSEVMGVIQAMFPNITIPEPIAFHFPRWHQNPLFRGSYSNWPPSFTSDHHTNLRATVNNRLWFAGEATSQKYFGFLHGAFFEGRDVANAMSKCIKGKGCVTFSHVEDVTNAKPYTI
ncbi:amine oxidase [Abortiporus biennis]|nr:amine oxidase [Abortiporus biennis]